MSIWKEKVLINDINDWTKNTMVELLGIEFMEAGDDFLKARMPVDHRTIQPMGIMHGGASAALAETVGSIAANYCVDRKTHYCVGLDINTSHIRMARGGYVTGIARPVHLGRTTHVWEVKAFDDVGKLVSQSRLTMAVLERK